MLKRALVTGAGGFIGHHLVRFLKERGYQVRGVDLRRPEFLPSVADQFLIGDLTDPKIARQAMRGVDEVYALAADMGGMGYLATQSAGLYLRNSLINLHTAQAAIEAGVGRYFFASSACVYPVERQRLAKVRALKESDALPANPADMYGWEKLSTEKFLLSSQTEFGLPVRIARFHNIYGPYGTWRGGREKAPAALCRKIAEAKLQSHPEIEIWGDGRQTRSFCYIDDCLEGIFRLTQSDYSQPLNLGQDSLITISDLADLIAKIAGVKLKKKNVPGPEGVRGRNSDNRLLNQVLEWRPQIPLSTGLSKTYSWIERQVRTKSRQIPARRSSTRSPVHA